MLLHSQPFLYGPRWWEGLTFDSFSSTAHVFLFFFKFLFVISVQSLFDNGSSPSVCINPQRCHYCYILGLRRSDNVGMSDVVRCRLCIFKTEQYLSDTHYLTLVILMPNLAIPETYYCNHRWQVCFVTITFKGICECVKITVIYLYSTVPNKDPNAQLTIQCYNSQWVLYWIINKI